MERLISFIFILLSFTSCISEDQASLSFSLTPTVEANAIEVDKIDTNSEEIDNDFIEEIDFEEAYVQRIDFQELPKISMDELELAQSASSESSDTLLASNSIASQITGIFIVHERTDGKPLKNIGISVDNYLNLYALAVNSSDTIIGLVEAEWTVIDELGANSNDVLLSTNDISSKDTDQFVKSNSVTMYPSVYRLEPNSKVNIAFGSFSYTSGIITVQKGSPNSIALSISETEVVVPDSTLANGSDLILYSLGFDRKENFLGAIDVSWSLSNNSFGTISSEDSSTNTFTSANAGLVNISIDFINSNGSHEDNFDLTVFNQSTNSAPETFGAESINLTEDTSKDFSISSSTDTDGDSLSYTLVSDVSNGALTNCMDLSGSESSTDLSCTYVPSANFNGSDSFTYKVNDGTEESEVTQITLVVDGVNDAPIAFGAETTSTTEDVVKNFTVSSPVDIDSSNLTFSITSGPSNGTITNCMDQAGSDNASDLTCSYTPNANFSGTDSFSYKSNDGEIDSSDSVITITTTSSNDAPTTAGNESSSTTEDSGTTFTISAGADEEGDALSYSIVTGPSNGTLTNCMDQAGSDNSLDLTCSYTPNNNYNGVDTFTYKISDGVDESSIATFSMTVTSVSDVPTTAGDESTSTNEDTAKSFSVGVGADGDGDSLTYIVVSGPSNGTLTNCMDQAGATSGSDLTCTYTPSSNYFGADSFTYKANDGANDSTNATISITVNSINDVPVISQSCTSSIYDSTAYSCTPGVTDPDAGDTQVWSKGGNHDCGAWLSLNTSTGALTGTPSGADVGSCTVEVKSTDQSGTGADSNLINFSLTTNSAPFISLWRTTSSNESITLPLRSGYNYNFTVDWGDSSTSTITSFGDADKTHTYASAGDYTITINGTVEAWYFANTGSKLNLIEVNNLGNVGWTNFFRAFQGCTNLTTISGGNTSAVTSFHSMFRSATSLASADFSTWDTSSVTTMQEMFEYTTSLTTLDLSGWDTSAVTTMYAMFYNATGFVSMDLSGNFMSSPAATSFHSMFHGAANLTSLDLSSWDTSAVTNAYNMFYNTDSLVTLNVSNWSNTVLTDMSGMFSYMDNISTLNLTNFLTPAATSMNSMFFNLKNITSLDISSFDTSNVTTMQRMFRGASELTSLDLRTFDMSNVQSIKEMFRGATDLASLNMTGWDTSSITNMQETFEDLGSMTTLDLSAWNTSAVTTMYAMFYNSDCITSLDLSGSFMSTGPATSLREMFYNASGITSLDLSTWDTSAVTSMLGLFNKASGLTSLDLSGWTNTVVTDMSSMFSETNGLTSIDLSTFGTASVTDMRSMFKNSTGLTSLDLTTFDMSNVTTIKEMFRGMTSLTSIDVTNWNTSSVTDMAELFEYTTSLTTVDLSTIDTTSLTSMYAMFYGATGLTSVDLSGTFMTTPRAASARQMFQGATNITSIDLSSWDTSAITNMYGMFSGATALTSLDLSNWSNSVVTDMAYMFSSLPNLATLNLSSFYTPSVINMEYMFYNATGLTSLNVSTFDTSNVLEMNQMFRQATGLTTLDLSMWDVSSVENFKEMFRSTTSLTSVDFAGWDTSSATNLNGLFEYSTAITTLDLSMFDTENVTDMRWLFYGATSLTSIDLDNWDLTSVSTSTDVFYGVTATVYCDQAGGSIFGETCN